MASSASSRCRHDLPGTVPISGRFMRSASLTIPTILPSASITGAALIRDPKRMSAAANTVASAGTVTTGRVITCMACMVLSSANDVVSSSSHVQADAALLQINQVNSRGCLMHIKGARPGPLYPLPAHCGVPEATHPQGVSALLRRLDPVGSREGCIMSNCLLADIGGTRARFALLSGSRVGPIESMATGEYASAIDAIKHFLNRQDDAGSVDGAVIAAAGPVEGGRCALTNARWILETDELKRTFRFRAVNIVNDLEVLAWSISHLGPSDVQSVGGGSEVAVEPVAVIAPGTGLGMACFIPGGCGGRVLPSEGGHGTFSPSDAPTTAAHTFPVRPNTHLSS